MKAFSTAAFAGSFFSFLLLHGANAATETVLYSFCSQNGCADGFAPYSGLIDVDGTLFGTTEEGGGPPGRGTVFSIDAKTGAERAVYSFCSSKECWKTGSLPYGSLLDVRGRLYGTTNSGGINKAGTVFSVNRTTGVERVLHVFGGHPDGAGSLAGLIAVKGTLYGTTAGGSNGGTVFSVDPATGAETVVYSFCSQANCADGNAPFAGLINVKGILYGTTEAGGANNDGTVFSVDPATGLETVVYSFCSQADCVDGEFPKAELIDVGGMLYGTTYTGGANGHGTVFSVDPVTGAESVVYSFCSLAACADGWGSTAGLTDVGSTLYGTTEWGGTYGSDVAYGGGTVFEVNPKTGAEKALHSFGNGTDGVAPADSLIDVGGKLYGTTYAGGASKSCYEGCGTVFAITP